jgi:intracellular sulfur oxidation DsrE/DsrF family protein
MQSVFSNGLRKLNEFQISQAGQRYTPGIDSTAPNIEIEALIDVIENLACGEIAETRFRDFLEELKKECYPIEAFRQSVANIQGEIALAESAVPGIMSALRNGASDSADAWLDRLSRIDSQLETERSLWKSKVDETKSKPNSGEIPLSRDSPQSRVNLIERCCGMIGRERDYVGSTAFKVLYEPRLLITGNWGTGKTHFVCDITQRRTSRDEVSLFVLAKNFQGNVLHEIARQTSPKTSVKRVLTNLQNLAESTKSRALVIVDGVNEGVRKDWKKAISKLLVHLASLPNVGIVVTCRTPFEKLAISAEDLATFRSVEHNGFTDYEFDAQSAFFSYYKLPLPEVPLLDVEFSRPLTLKLICQSLSRLTGVKRKQDFEGIASGQKGMTFVLESFIQHASEQIEKDWGLPSKSCWWLMKGDDKQTDPVLSGLAPCMAFKLRGYVLKSEVNRIVGARFPSLSKSERLKFIDALRSNGLIEEDIIWLSSKTGSKSRHVFRLPYERFSDHLIARHLMKMYLDTASEQSIRGSFLAKSSLGRIFRIGPYGTQYVEPGWAQALIVEFQRRIGEKICGEKKELFFWLPERAQKYSAYFEPLVDGLFWRAAADFDKSTFLVLREQMRANRDSWEMGIDALLALSVKANHPFHPNRLFATLATVSLTQRDAQWSEFLRRKYASTSVLRLTTWAQREELKNLSQDVAERLIVVFSLVLTTVVRHDRDIATKALVQIGEAFPEALFAHVQKTLSFSDPYVPERFLAAAYGVTLSKINSEEAVTFRPLVGNLARVLYENMFCHNAPYGTHHTLMRDYALGIIELAKSVRAVKLPKNARTFLCKRYPGIRSSFSDDASNDAIVAQETKGTIRMDFGNYTIGGLIPGRANYDHKHRDYLQVRAKIERRIFELGYTQEAFGKIDQQISRDDFRSQNGQKVDRYGKKYAWIAYFEMWGERELNNRLPDWRIGERSSDCDIDPSFPKRPPNWELPSIDLLGDVTIDTASWVGGDFTPDLRAIQVVEEINGDPGPWVLLDGDIRHVSGDLDREIFAFSQVGLVAKADVDVLKSKFMDVSYPGNLSFPQGTSAHYLFAGEIGTRTNAFPELLAKGNKYRRQADEAFREFSNVYSSKQSSNRAEPIRGVTVEIPYVQYSWERYHSALNDFSGFTAPAPRLLQRLKLVASGRSVDFRDQTGKVATKYRCSRNGFGASGHGLLYIRADLLSAYLLESDQVLAWCSWGERDWQRVAGSADPNNNPARSEIYQNHKHIFRSFNVWDPRADIRSQPVE